MSSRKEQPRCRELAVGMNEPPEAVLQGLAMAGLVGILRQLGDLAELAADVFQELQDQVLAASARGRRLAMRTKQLEADLQPLIDQDSVMDAAAPNTERLRWHADPKVSHGVVAAGDMPYFIAEYIQHCRGPPGLSILDKYDADGDGACLRRYTNPAFFRTKLQQDTLVRAQAYLRGKENRPKFQSSSDNYRPPKSALTGFRSETDTSDNSLPRFLSMLRQLRHRQTSGSVFSSLKLQPQQNIQKFESSPEEKASSVDHSEIEISFTSSSDIYIEMGNIAVDSSTAAEKAEENQQGNGQQFQESVMPYCSDAGSDYGEQCGELGRTSSFEAWLSPDFPTPEHDSIEEESSHDTSDGIISHGITSTNGSHSSAMKANQNSGTAEMFSNKRYKGSFELFASRVSSLPRKLFIKKHDPSTDSFRNETNKQLESTGTDSSLASCSEGSITCCNPQDIPDEAVLPTLAADPAFSIHDSVQETEQCYLNHENTSLQSTKAPSCDASGHSEIHHKQNSPSISNQGSSSSSPDKCEDPKTTSTSTTTDSKNVLWRSMKTSMCEINESLHNATNVQTEYSCSEDAEVVIPLPPPIPPMQWLSVKVHTGPFTHRKSLIKDSMQHAEGKILKTTGFSELTPHSDQDCSEPACTNPQPEADIHLQQETRQQFFSGESDKNMQVRDRQTEKQIEDHEIFHRKGTDILAAPRSALSISEANKLSNDKQNSPACQNNKGCGDDLQNESVFFSAVQQLAKMSPPSVPRPKYSLLEVGSHERIKLRNGPSLMHPSRNILDQRSELLKDKVISVKPVHERSNVTGSPMNPRVAAVLKRADDIRQAHANDNTDSEDGWIDSD
ncbi:hypothetical protein EJB05_10405, partial [Eragrostis curvula]